MTESLDKILSTAERIAFSLIALYIAVYLINLSATLDPTGYGHMLLGALTIIFAIAGLFILFLVLVNFLNLGLFRNRK